MPCNFAVSGEERTSVDDAVIMQVMDGLAQLHKVVPDEALRDQLLLRLLRRDQPGDDIWSRTRKV